MKCKWYAEFEGVCTNGECPYRGDTCPTSEHMEACKYSENKYEVSELVKILRCCSNIGYICEECPANLDGEDCDGRLAKLQAADMLEKLAAEKAKKPEWISVKDRLPEIRTPVLGWYKGEFSYDYPQMVVTWGGEYWRIEHVRLNADLITHWMPLPKPPKEEER